ncbi:TPA: beta strand repeat-containing protein, partial [Campylobacter jejuni]
SANSDGINISARVTIGTFNNSGTINSHNNKVGIKIADGTTIDNFSNEGLIQGGRGIDVADGTTIDNFSNSGTIHGINNRGINIGIIPPKNYNKQPAGVNIKTLTNSGTIKNDNTSNGIRVGYATIDNFSNSGLIQGNSNVGGLYTINAKIGTLTNNGTITNNGTLQPSIKTSVSSGTFLIYSTIENFTNTGSTSGIMGVNLAQVTIDNFTNKGTIESTSSNALAAGVNIMVVSGNPSNIGTFTNEGIIKSRAQGILVEIGNEIDTFTNKGTIDADLNGISFYDTGDFSGETVKLSKIILESGSTIKARRNGINLAGSSKSIQVDNIDVKKDATVSGDNAGISIGVDKKVNGQITISGSVTGGKAGIVNEGIIGNALDSSSDANTGIVITKSGSISSSSGGSGIVNKGNGSISGEIKVENGAKVDGGITNTGSASISGDIVVESGGKLDSITNTSTSSTGIIGSITNNSDNKLEISNGEGATIGGGIVNNGNADLT